MSSGLASSLEISAKIIRENMGDPNKATSEIFQRMECTAALLEKEKNEYLVCMMLGFTAALTVVQELNNIKEIMKNENFKNAAKEIASIKEEVENPKQGGANPATPKTTTYMT